MCAVPKQPENETEASIQPPWLVVLLALKPPSLSMYRVWQRAGVTKGRLYWLRKSSDLRVSMACHLARAADINPGKYVEALAEYLGPKPLLPKPQREKAPPRRKRQYLCSVCGKQGHQSRTCRSVSLSGAHLLLARGAAVAQHDLSTKRKKGRRCGR